MLTIIVVVISMLFSTFQTIKAVRISQTQTGTQLFGWITYTIILSIFKQPLSRPHLYVEFIFSMSHKGRIKGGGRQGCLWRKSMLL